MLVARAKDFGVSFAVLMPAIACVLLASVILPMLTRRPPLGVRSAPAV
jgi:diacylglycerol kinase